MIRIFLAVLVTAAVAVGQEEPVVSKKRIVPVKTFSTNNGNPETIAKILGDQFPGIAFSAGMETGDIYARVDGEDADRVARLIQEISIRTNEALLQRQARQAAEHRRMQQQQEAEQENGKSNAEVLKTYQLKYVPAEEAARVLHALGFDGNANIAAFGSSLMMRGPAATIEQVSMLLKQVDVPQKTDGASKIAAVQEPDFGQGSELIIEMFEEDSRQQSEASESKLFDRARALSEMVRNRSDAATTQDIRGELMKVVQQQFRVKMEQERRELKQIQRRLEQITQRLEMQQRLADQIVQKRVDQLMTDDKGLLMLKQRELAAQNQQSAFMRRDQQLAMQQLQAALETLHAEELQRGEELTGEQAELKAILEAEYLAYKNALRLALPKTQITEVETGIQRKNVEREELLAAERAQADAMRAQVELDKARIQLEQLKLDQNGDVVSRKQMEAKQQILEQRAAELEDLKASLQRNDQKQNGQLAEQEMILEQAKQELQRKLRPDSAVEGSAGNVSGSVSDGQPAAADEIDGVEIKETKPKMEPELIQS